MIRSEDAAHALLVLPKARALLAGGAKDRVVGTMLETVGSRLTADWPQMQRALDVDVRRLATGAIGEAHRGLALEHATQAEDQLRLFMEHGMPKQFPRPAGMEQVTAAEARASGAARAGGAARPTWTAGPPTGWADVDAAMKRTEQRFARFQNAWAQAAANQASGEGRVTEVISDNVRLVKDASGRTRVIYDA